MTPLLMGCAVLLLLVLGVGGAGFFWLSRRLGPTVRAVAPTPSPTIAPPSASVPPSPALPPPTPAPVVDDAREAISGVVRRHEHEVHACYERALRTDPRLTARIETHFSIANDGTVSDATAEGSPSELTDCIAARIRTWTFPPSAASGNTEVDYPFVFSAE